jgi:glycopeptide antibiotics resistance protein
MRLRHPQMRFVLLAAAMVAVILLVCLYPFRFEIRHGGINALGALIGSWATAPKPVDFILNIALYMPLGGFGALSFPRSRGRLVRIGIVTLGGSALSVAVELAQYFDRARVTAATDVYANVLGTLLGAVAAVALVRR